ncbi:MAG: anthranilate synthase component 1 [Allosphingosinicella sp.]
MPSLREGEAVALRRSLASPPDLVSLYAHLSDGGRRADTILLERSAGPSFLLDQAAVRAECRGQSVVLTALGEGGRNVLSAIARRLAARVAMRSVDAIELRFPPVAGDDSEARLLAPSPLDALRALTGLTSRSPEEAATLMAMGVFAFDHADLFERLPPAREDPLDFPDYVFWLAESLIVAEPGAKPRLVCTAFGAEDEGASRRAYFAAAERLARLVSRCEGAIQVTPPATVSAPPAGPEPEVDLDDEAYGAIVSSLRERIVAGDVYQIVPSRTFRAACPDPMASYLALRRLDPSPYQFFVAAGRHMLFGASPETAVRVFRRDRSPMVEVKPIAGTRARGATDDEDDRLEAEMRLDTKETAEHMMLVDLARNDVARVSRPGTRRLEGLMVVERYARVMHLVSSVTGVLRTGLDSLHALQACLNMGTLTGAPKIRATELLRRTERTKRGPYGGAVGWLDGDGMLDTGVVIRSAVVRDGIAFVRAGAGVVYDSDPQLEADETRRKASALLSVLAATGAAT